MRGFAADGFVRVQRTVLRRVVCDRLQALLRGDFYVRNSLGGEEYEPIVREAKSLMDVVPASSLPQAPAAAAQGMMIMDKNGHNIIQDGNHGRAGQSDDFSTDGEKQSLPSTSVPVVPSGSSSPSLPPPPPITEEKEKPLPPPPKQSTPFSSNLEIFIQLIASSIMIDASMRGENSGESDTRFIKKKKKMLVKTLSGPKLGDFCKEVLRFDAVRRGEAVSDTEIFESEESQSESSSNSEEEEESANEKEVDEQKRKKKKFGLYPSISSQPLNQKLKTEPQQTQTKTTSHHYTQISQKPSPPRRHHHYKSSGGEGSSSMNDDEHDNNEINSEEDHQSTASNSSDDAFSSSLNSPSGTEENSTLDGFSTSATSSKKHQRKGKKRKKRKLEKERKRIKKEERRQKGSANVAKKN